MLPSTRKQVSVIIPVFNAEKDFSRCVESIINQTHSQLEVFITDDGSSDRSSSLIDESAAGDARIIVVHQKNSGVSSARNRGLELASGDYYHFPDGDDYIELDTYEYCLNLIDKYGCDAVNFEHFGTFSDHETSHQLSDDCYGLKDRYSTQMLLCTKVAFACNKLYSARIIAGLRFREDIARGEDGLFAKYAMEQADKVWFDSRPLYHYMQSDDSACRGTFRSSQLSALLLYAAYDELYAIYPDLLIHNMENMAHLCITLYYDMWADTAEYSAQRDWVYQEFKQHRPFIDNNSLSARNKLKFSFFSLSPSLFCRFHKRLHRLS